MVAYRFGICDKREKRQLHGTGYIPCKECDELTKEELLSNIKKNRQCKLPFPRGDFPD